MIARFLLAAIGAFCAGAGTFALAQTTPAPPSAPTPPSSLASPFIDPAIGVSLDRAIARALEVARDERAHEAVAIYRMSVQALARQNLTVVGQSYELGRATVFDVLAEQRRYLDVERAYAEALRTAYEARTALGVAVGVVR